MGALGGRSREIAAAGVAMLAMLVSAPTAQPASSAATPSCSEAQAAAASARQAVSRSQNRVKTARKIAQRTGTERAREALKRAKRKLRRARGRLAAANATVETACPPPQRLLVSIGDSVVPYYAPGLQSLYAGTRGVTKRSERSAPGATTTQLLAGSAWSGALGDINASSDTEVVSIEIGGWDALSGGCDDQFHLPACPFRANFSSILSQLQAALEADPGEELLVAMAYYNPASGKMDVQEADYDDKLLGDDLVLDCDQPGTDLGLNDVIAEEARDAGIPMANPYAAFKTGGQAFMSDALHPSASGSAAIVDAFEAASVPCA